MPRNAVVEPTVLEDFILEGYPFAASRRRLVAVPGRTRLVPVPPVVRLVRVPFIRRLFTVTGEV
jgi:hypothetical protein